MDRRRRRVIEACGAAVLGLAGCLGRNESAPGTRRSQTSDTPTDDHDTLSGTPPGGSTTSPAGPPDDEGTPRGPQRTIWQVDTGKTTNRPHVVDGTCYLGTGEHDEAGEAELLAVDADGTERWRQGVGQSVSDVAAVTGDMVYAITGDTTTSGLHGEDYRVQAYDAASGEEQWSWAPEKRYKFFESIGVRDGTVFVGTHDDALQDEGEQVVAVADGSAVWTVESGDVMGGTLVGETVVADTAAGLAAFAAGDGTERWTHAESGYGSLDPERFGDLVLAGDESVHALGAETGEEQWSVTDRKVTTWHAEGSTAYLGGEQVAAVDESGRAAWTYNAGGVPSGVGTADWLVGTAERSLFCLERASGDERWRVEVDTEFPSPGGLADGRLPYATREDGLVVVSAETGEEVWTWSTSVGLTDPVVADGAVVVGREGGGLWGLEP